MTFNNPQPHQDEQKYSHTEEGRILLQRPRAVLYTRTTRKQIEQIDSAVPYHELQEQTLRQICEVNGFDVVEVVSDVQKLKNLNRLGIKRIRSLVRAKSVDVVCATSYDRIAGANYFSKFQSELVRNGVALYLSEEPLNPETLESEMKGVLQTISKAHSSDVMGQVVAMAKELERQAMRERITRSLHHRAAKEMYSNGKSPFGFLKIPEKQTLSHDQSKVHIIKQMFEIYVETRSDLKVRDWLKTQAIHSPEGKPEWAIGTIKALLQNVRYIGQIELNRKNKGLSDTSVPDEYQYRIIEATSYGPMISRELWDLAQNIRLEQAQKSLRLAKSHC